MALMEDEHQPEQDDLNVEVEGLASGGDSGTMGSTKCRYVVASSTYICAHTAFQAQTLDSLRL